MHFTTFKKDKMHFVNFKKARVLHSLKLHILEGILAYVDSLDLDSNHDLNKDKENSYTKIKYRI